MEQYSGGMSEEMQNYSLWEQDYYGMVSQGFSVCNEAQTRNYNNISINIDDDNHATAPPEAARNVFSPDAANPAAKTKRRRSKGAAASQPTTFLSASISNFRALVQQHTGCHNANSSPKGPITLCFATPASTHTNKQYY